MAHGTFYRYFANKEEIFLRLVARLEDSLKRAILRAISPAGSTSSLERLIAGYRAFLNFIAENAELYQALREAEFVDEGIGHFVGLRWIVWEGHEVIPEPIPTAMLEFIMHGVAPSD